MNQQHELAPVTLVIVRHGQTEWNTQFRWQGWKDSPLTEEGRKQAREAALIAARYGKPDCIYSSDSGRAVETSGIIADSLGIRGMVPIVVSNCLRERYYGSHEGLDAKEIEEKYPGTRFRPGADTRELYRPPGGGESYQEARIRLNALLSRVLEHHEGKTVMMVTHSGIVRLFDSLARGVCLEEIWERHPPNACVFVLRVWKSGRVHVLRDMMEGGAKPGVPY